MKTQWSKWLVLLVAGAAGLTGACGEVPSSDESGVAGPRSEAAAATQQSAALRNIGTGAIGGVGTISLPPEDPDDPTMKPRRSLPPSASPASASTMTVSFVDRSSYETGFHLYRGTDFSGPWTLVATLPAAAGLNGNVTFTDSGLAADTEYWYYVGAFNGHGESASVQEPATTFDGRGGVARVQIKFHTSTVDDANTDDNVHVALNYYEENHGTYLDYGRNDFERGDTFTYDLVADDIGDLSQLNEIYIWKTGTDGWCFDKMTLLVNGVAVYEENRSACQWLDDDNGNRNYYVVGKAGLRASALWKAYTATIPNPNLPRLDISQRVEGFVGNVVDQLASTEGTSWAGDALDNGYWVKVTKKDDAAVHVQFRLGVNQSSLIPGNELEAMVSFDLRFTAVCRTATAPPKVVISVENKKADVSFSVLSEIETLGIINFFRDDIESGIAAGLPSLTQTITLDNRLNCAMPSVGSDGSVGFDLSFRTKIGGGVIGTIGGGTIATAAFSSK